MLVASDLACDESKRIIVQDFRDELHPTVLRKLADKHIFKVQNTKYIIK